MQNHKMVGIGYQRKEWEIIVKPNAFVLQHRYPVPVSLVPAKKN